jgi:hypothetical protein
MEPPAGFSKRIFPLPVHKRIPLWTTHRRTADFNPPYAALSVVCEATVQVYKRRYVDNARDTASAAKQHTHKTDSDSHSEFVVAAVAESFGEQASNVRQAERSDSSTRTLPNSTQGSLCRG